MRRVGAGPRIGAGRRAGVGCRAPGARRKADERGSVTAEFAAVVPAAMLVLAFCLGAVQLVGQQLRVTDAAANAARSLARGDGDGLAASRVEAAIGPATLRQRREGAFVCVTLEAPAAFAPAALAGIAVTGSGCALAG